MSQVIASLPKRSPLNILLLAVFLVYDVAAVVGIFFFDIFGELAYVIARWNYDVGDVFFSLGFIVVIVVLFMFTATLIAKFPRTTRGAVDLFLPVAVTFVLFLIFASDLWNALYMMALVEFAAMSMAVGLNAGLPVLKKLRRSKMLGWSDRYFEHQAKIFNSGRPYASWQKPLVFLKNLLYTVLLLLFGPMTFLWWALLLEVMVFLDFFADPFSVLATLSFIAFVVMQVPLIRSRYRMTIEYDKIMGTGEYRKKNKKILNAK